MARRRVFACHAAGERMMRALARLRTLVEKGGFNPDQPRVPAGSPEGGQWAGGEGSSESQQPGIGHNRGPALDLPQASPSKTQAAKALARAIALQALRRAGPVGAILTTIGIGHWLYSEYQAIRSYQDEPKSLGELQEHVGKKRAGYDDHHIVEQGAGSREGFARSDIDGLDNVVSIPRYKHHEITGWDVKKNSNFGNLAPRDYLRDRSWAEHVEVGHQALRLFKVLK